MLYNVTGEFVKITATSGTIQNTSNIYTVEVSSKAEPDSGILLYPLNKFSFSELILYVRCVDVGGRAVINVVPFTVDMGVGGSASGGASSGTLSFDDSDVADIFKP